MGVEESLLRFLDETEVRASTYEGYRDIVRTHLIPYGEDVIAPGGVRRYVEAKRRQGLAPGTIRQHLVVLQAAKLLGKVKYPKSVQRLRLPTDEEVQKLIEGSEGLLRRAVLLAAYGGLRRGEVCGLLWDDVQADRLFVTQRKWRTEVDVPKSGKPRVVYLDPVLREELGDRDEGFVVPTSTDGLDRRFYWLRKRTGYRYTFHSLRHWHAQKLLDGGVNVKVVSERLGHADVSTTLRIYTHVLPSMQEDAVRCLPDLRLSRVTAVDEGPCSTTTTSASCGSSSSEEWWPRLECGLGI